MTTLFINASKDPNGTTDEIAHELTDNFKTLNLVDYLVYPLGQENKPDDQFNEVVENVRKADTLIIGTPVYWSSMSAYMKIMIDRMGYYRENDNVFTGQDLHVIIDGMEPSDAIPPITHVWDHIARRYGMNFKDVSSTANEARSNKF